MARLISGENTMHITPAFWAALDDDITYSTEWQTIVYARLSQNSHSYYSTSTGKFTCPVKGWYQFSAQLVLDQMADTDGTMSFSINDSTSALIASVSCTQDYGQFDGNSIAGNYLLNPGDTVKVMRFLQTGATTRSSEPYAGYFSGHFIGR